jgi:succinate dehydrogenase / fumarate reductase flavoprotein subunit/fumarate reductase flavoprotein subunit
VHLVASHLGADFVEKNFPGMCQRCSIFGYDLARKPVPVSPTAHYMMGGAVIDKKCFTSLEGLFCAGEDSGGIHGANRLGGNGIADSCVFGRLAGKAMAEYMEKGRAVPKADGAQVKELIADYVKPFDHDKGTAHFEVRDRLRELNWAKVGIVRSDKGLSEAADEIESLCDEAGRVRLEGPMTYNMAWNEWINLLNMLDVSRMVVHSATHRNETRGAHAREEFPEQDDKNGLFNVLLVKGEKGRPVIHKQPSDLKYIKPDDLAQG